MSFIKMVLVDIHRGLSQNKYRFIISSILVFVIVMSFLTRIAFFKRVGEDYGSFGLTDILIYIFKGLEPINPDDMKRVDIPWIWISVQFMCAFVNLDYTYKDRIDYGRLVLIESRSKGKWWISKCIYTITAVALIYAVIWGISIIGCLAMGNIKMPYNEQITEKVSQMFINEKNVSDMVGFIVVVPILCSMAISVMQTTLSLFVGPVVSLILIFFLDVMAVYTDYFWLPGNISMLVRSARYYEGGFNTNIGVLICFFIIVVSMVVGYFKLKKSDMI